MKLQEYRVMNKQTPSFYRHLEDAVVKTLEISNMNSPKLFFGCLMDIVSVDPEISGAREFSLLPCAGRPEFLSLLREEDLERADQIPEQIGKATKVLMSDMSQTEAHEFSRAFANAVYRFYGWNR